MVHAASSTFAIYFMFSDMQIQEILYTTYMAQITHLIEAKLPLQVTILGHLAHYVQAPDQIAIDVKLWKHRPIAVGL